jgi:hypothetical protein
MDLGIARLVLSLTFGIVIVVIMAQIFYKKDAAHDQFTDAMFAGQSSMKKTLVIF